MDGVGSHISLLKESVLTVLGIVCLGFTTIWGAVSYIVKCLMKQSLKN